jgi:dolichyl-phosphate beta-glucosyltransferase
MPIDLSIVIPAYEEGGKIARDVEAAAAFLQANGLTGEIIVVDDGSSDDTAQAGRGACVPPDVELNVIRYEPHRGKGTAVRTGMMASTGQYAMFADCGLCVPYGNALLGLEMLKNGECDIAHGSRRHIQSDILRDQPLRRRVTSRAFRWSIRRLVSLPSGLTDTQCGFKIYKGDIARELYGRCITDGFMFDIEIILRAARQGYRIREFPIEWRCDLDTRLSIVRTPWPLLAELHKIQHTISRESTPPPPARRGPAPHKD